MSKERELLLLITKRFQEEFNNPEWYSEVDKELQAEIKELLAQPEPKPEAWMLIDKETGARIPRAYKPEKVSKDRWKLYPLYSAPSKREPLSDDELNEMADKYITDEACAGYFNGFRDAEKAHGIGEL